ncbi:hypothetical protein SNE40_023150 [Patella caerulea]|uniref:Lariat debranching enzyme C-terminal domain-containing protein n=1 Tax=Patella caerulea TaxID=87958 RepID=A0AAN8G5R3_PATCE
MKIAVEGCCHGELDKIYETIQHLEKKNDMKVDILLICGDFQSVRNKGDLQCMAVPPKYQKLNTFYKYYSGEKVAPVLTVFVGGNHEASNYLQELPYGGWVATNIYYMGYGNVVEFGGIRIAGLSGIYNGKDYTKGHFERPPYNDSTKRSVYHVRNLEVFRFKQISRPIDIFLSHDWPRGIYHYGNVNKLLRGKPFFAEEIESNKLGSAPGEELLHVLKPEYWFAAHLHVKFAAYVQHETENNVERTTKFLSLDKCLPRRKFLQVLDIPHDNNLPLKLQLDAEWLSILKSTNHLLNLNPSSSFMPGPGSNERWDFRVTDEDINSLKEDFGGDLTIPDTFEETAPVHEQNGSSRTNLQPRIIINPQTTLLCTMLDITDPNAVFLGKDSGYVQNILSPPQTNNPDEIDVNEDDVDDDDDDVDDGGNSDVNSTINTTYESFSVNNTEFSLDTSASDMSFSSVNTAEISIEDDDELKAIMDLQKAERLLDEAANSDKVSDDDDDLLSSGTATKQTTSTPSHGKHPKILDCQQFEVSLEYTAHSPQESEPEGPVTDIEVMSPGVVDNSSAESSAEDIATSTKAEKRASDSDDSPSVKKVKMKRRNVDLYSDNEIN